MLNHATENPVTLTREPRWPAAVAVLAAGGLYAALPETLSAGPRWLMPLVVGVVLVPTVITHRVGRHDLNRFLGFTIEVVLAGMMVWSLGLLIYGLVTHCETPGVLLRSAALLWATNVVVFALWYWRLDGGGPHERDARGGHTRGAFLFPQMTEDGAAAAGVGKCAGAGGADCGARGEAGGVNWSPRFVDYLFLAFNTSTAFSPTDVPVLSRWAKVLVMLQSLISLTTIAILVGRAVNIL
jgi:hypothetical protein